MVAHGQGIKMLPGHQQVAKGSAIDSEADRRSSQLSAGPLTRVLGVVVFRMNRPEFVGPGPPPEPEPDARAEAVVRGRLLL
jgi:hypothetical protein